MKILNSFDSSPAMSSLIQALHIRDETGLRAQMPLKFFLLYLVLGTRRQSKLGSTKMVVVVVKLLHCANVIIGDFLTCSNPSSFRRHS